MATNTAGTEKVHETRFGDDGHELGKSITNTEKGSSIGASSIGGGIVLSDEYHRAERRLVRKLDMVILPITMILYLSAYLDRGNLGNARLQGLQTNVLGGSDSYFSICLACFYITYIVFNIPGNIAAKAFPPSRVIAIAAFIWGTAATLQAAAFNFPGLVVCRLLIGIGEAGFGPTVPLYYSFWYKRDEIAVRIALFIGMGSLAGAFGGLIAYGVQHINSSVETYKILFLIEGLPTVVIAFFLWFFLPDRPETSKYINEDERTLAHTRLNSQGPKENPNSFDIRGLKRALTDWHVWMVCGMYLGINLTLGSISGFLPTIIKTLGYSNADAQLFTVPPYAVATFTAITVCFISDRVKMRGPFVAGLSCLSMIGFIILLTVHNNQHVRYFAVFLVVGALEDAKTDLATSFASVFTDEGAAEPSFIMEAIMAIIARCLGTFTCIPLCLSWVSNNSGNESARAVGLAMLNTIGQCFAILASFIFPSTEGPQYTKGLALNLAFTCTTIILSSTLSLSLYLENKRRDTEEGGRPTDQQGIDTETHHDKAVGFRYIP